MTVLHMQEEIRVYDHLKRGIFGVILLIFLILLGIEVTSTRLSLTTSSLEGIAGEALQLEGAAAAESGIRVLADGEMVGTTTTDRRGRWRLVVGLPVEAGTYDLQIVASDAAGQTISQLDFDQQLVIHSNQLQPLWPQPILENLTVEGSNPAHVTLSGVANANSRVMLRLNGEPLGIVKVDEEGQWTHQSTSYPDRNEHQLTIEELSLVGVSIPGSLVTETIRIASVSTGPTATASVPVVEAAPDTIDEVVEESVAEAVVATPTPTLIPIAKPKIEIVAQVGGFQQPMMRVSGVGEPNLSGTLILNGMELAVVTIDEAGAWIWEGLVEDYVAQTWELTYGEGHSTTMQFAPEHPQVVQPTLIVEDNIAFGSGTPESLIILSLNGVDLEALKVDADGEWRSTIIGTSAGTHQLTASALDVDGEIAASAEMTFVVHPAPHIVTAEDRGGNSYKLTGVAVASSTVELLLNGEALDTVEVDANGVWAWFGYHDPVDILQYAVVDAQGMTSQSFKLGGDDFVELSGWSLDHDDVESGLRINGVADPGSTVQLVIDGVAVATLQTDEFGAWAWQSGLPTFGVHQIVAQVVSAENVILSGTAVQPLMRYALPQVDVEAVIQDAADGKIELNGQATPSGLVAILIDGRTRKNAIVDEFGRWSWSGSVPQSGEHVLQLNALTPFGELVGEGEPIIFERE